MPSSFSILAFILFFASLLADIKDKNKIRHFGWGVIVPLIFLAIPAVAIFILQNHFSATLVIGAVTIVQMLIAGVRISHLMIVGAIGAIGFAGYLGIKNYNTPPQPKEKQNFRKTRIETWRDPWSDITGKGWQIIQSLYAIGSGGLFGAGLGKSKQKYLYLPEPQNDFIFSVLAEEFGYVGCLGVMLLFLIFIWRGIIISMRAKDTAIGITTLIGIQAIINIAVVTNTIPVTGMELPFFSYGGTQIMFNLLAVGILLNISRSAKK